jgi:hypothetical protein
VISDDQLQQARVQSKEADVVISQYHREQAELFEQRLKDNPVFTDDELVYSRETLCPRGHGLAYPCGCDPFHYWDCSAILKGIADKTVQHTGQLPFAFYDVKAEVDGLTTRGIFKPKKVMT